MAGTLTISTLSDGTNSTSATNCIQGSAKAWVNFNGTGTVAIRASYNVSSITDNGTGDYTVNFTTAMPNANYGIALACVGYLNSAGGTVVPQIVSTTFPNAATYSTTAVRVSAKIANSNNTEDVSVFCVSVFSS
jgi:hypothetical protein